MIYTASWFKSKDWKGSLASISKTIPKEIRIRSCLSLPSLQPDWSLLMDFKEEKIAWDEYEAGYLSALDIKLAEGFILEDLKILKSYENGNDLTLMCWEHSPKQCHRRLLIQWLNQNNFSINPQNIK